MSAQPERLDYTRRTFATLTVDLLRYIAQYIPSIQSTARVNVGVRFLRLVAGAIDVLLRYLDLQFQERSLSRCKRLRNQIRNVEILNFKMNGPTGATGEAQFTQTNGGAGNIPQWTVITTAVTPARQYLTLDAAVAPGLGLAVILPIVQGSRIIDELLSEASDGQLSQLYVLLNSNPTKEYITIKVSGVNWIQVDDLLGYGPQDQVFEVAYDENMFGYVKFGDNENGLSPTLGDRITSTYVASLGTRGVADPAELSSLPTLIGYDVTNPDGTTGASNGDTVDSVGINAPKQFSTQWRAVSLEDFENLATRVNGVYSASAQRVSGFVMDLYIVPTGGGSPATSVINAVINYLTPRVQDATQLNVTGFALAYMLVNTQIKLKSRQYSKEDSENIIRTAVNEFLDYTNTKVGVAWAPSDFHALLEGLEDGNLIDLVDDTTFSRVPDIGANAVATGANLTISDIIINPEADYAEYTILRKDDDEFWVYKDNVLDTNSPGTLDTVFTTVGGEVTFAILRDVPLAIIPVGSAWSFKTSTSNGPVRIEGDELPQPFTGNEENFTMLLYYPDEWSLPA